MKKIIHLSSVHNALDSRIVHKELMCLQRYFSSYYLCLNAKNNFKYENIEIISLNVNYYGKIKRIFFSPIRLFIKALKLNGDIYHFHDPELMIIGILLKMFGKRVIYDIHENLRGMIFSRKWIKNHFIKKIIMHYAWFLDRLTIHVVDGIVLARPDLKKYYSRKKNIVFKNVPNLQKYNIKNNERKQKNNIPVIIYSGGLTQIRGICQLIEAMHILKGKAILWLMGPWLEDDLQKRCENLRGYKYVKYIGILPYGEHFQYIKQADFGIIPFLPAPNHNTTLPNKPFEYILNNIPVLMSNFKYWKIIFNNIAYFFDPTNPHDIAKIIEKAIQSNNTDMLKNAKKRLYSEFNLEIECKKLITFYKKILNEK